MKADFISQDRHSSTQQGAVIAVHLPTVKDVHLTEHKHQDAEYREEKAEWIASNPNREPAEGERNVADQVETLEPWTYEHRPSIDRHLGRRHKFESSKLSGVSDGRSFRGHTAAFAGDLSPDDRSRGPLDVVSKPGG